MEPISLERRSGAASRRQDGLVTMTQMARYSVELDAIREAIAALALSRLADTSAWVQTNWMLAQAQGALRRAASGWWMAAPEVEQLEGAVRSAWVALRDLEALGQGPPRWPAGPSARSDRRHRVPPPPEAGPASDGHR